MWLKSFRRKKKRRSTSGNYRKRSRSYEMTDGRFSRVPETTSRRFERAGRQERCVCVSDHGPRAVLCLPQTPFCSRGHRERRDEGSAEEYRWQKCAWDAQVPEGNTFDNSIMFPFFFFFFSRAIRLPSGQIAVVITGPIEAHRRTS